MQSTLVSFWSMANCMVLFSKSKSSANFSEVSSCTIFYCHEIISYTQPIALFTNMGTSNVHISHIPWEQAFQGATDFISLCLSWHSIVDRLASTEYGLIFSLFEIATAAGAHNDKKIHQSKTLKLQRVRNFKQGYGLIWPVWSCLTKQMG